MLDWQIEQEIKQLRAEVDTLKSRDVITRDMNAQTKDVFKELMKDIIFDLVWDEVFYISSMDGPAATTTSASELFSSATRQADTSAESFLSTDRISKFRCHFYFNGTDVTDCTAYIGSMGTATTDTGITSINQTGMEYLAIKVTNGVVTLVSKSHLGSKEKSTQYTITDDTTYRLDINYFPRERAEFYINGKFVGGMTEYLPGQPNIVTFFPLMVSITRGGATNRNVTVESWEFIQERQ
jgi:hypothetical protein